MELTLSQLYIIDRFLEQHQLDFLDFKLEVKDHLATATEVLMEENKIPFEDENGNPFMPTILLRNAICYLGGILLTCSISAQSLICVVCLCWVHGIIEWM